MPIRVKPTAEIAAKWSRVSTTRDADYKSGVSDPAVDWAKAAAASEDAYKEGVQQAISRGAFGKGIAASGDEKWRRKTTEVGASRWSPGIRAATGDFEKGFGPFREVLERVELPPRRPRGDPANLDRAAAVAAALTKKRRGG